MLGQHVGDEQYGLLEQMRGEAVSQRVRRTPIGQPSQFGGHVADPIGHRLPERVAVLH